MTQPTNDSVELDEILNDCIFHPSDIEMDEERRNYAKKAIQTLIDKRVNDARIDERTQAQNFLHGLTITPENRHLFDVLSYNNHERLAQLQSNTSKGDK